jgi:hypothetical protein
MLRSRKANFVLDQAGASLLEFAIVFPLLLMIFFGIITLGLNNVDRELHYLSLMKFGRILATGHPQISIACDSQELKSMLYSGDATLTDGTIQNLFSGLSSLKYKPEVDQTTYTINEFYYNPSDPTPSGYYYLTINLEARRDCLFCDVDLGTGVSVNFERLADAKDKFFFLLEETSPLWKCRTTGLESP